MYTRLRALFHVQTGDAESVAELVTEALQERVDAPRATVYTVMDDERRALAEYTRAFRWVVAGDAAFTTRRNDGGHVWGLPELLWLIEAFLCSGDMRRLYSPPRNAVTNGEFPTLCITKEWLFENPVAAFTTFEIVMQLEFLTWAMVDKIRPVVRTKQWVKEFTALFELVRSRAQIVCTQPMAADVVCQQHRFTPPEHVSAVDAYNGMSDDEAEDEEVAASKAKAVADSLVDAPVFVNSSFIFEVQSYVHEIETSIIDMCRFTDAGPLIPGEKYAADVGKVRKRLFTAVIRQEESTTRNGFKSYVAETMILPCDRRIFDMRFNNFRRPSAAEILSTKNSAMVLVPGFSDAWPVTHQRLFADYMLFARMERMLTDVLPTVIRRCVLLDLYVVTVPGTRCTFTSLVSAFVWLRKTGNVADKVLMGDTWVDMTVIDS